MLSALAAGILVTLVFAPFYLRTGRPKTKFVALILLTAVFAYVLRLLTR